MRNFIKTNTKKRVLIVVLTAFLALFTALACLSYSGNDGGVYAYSAIIPQEIIADQYTLGASVSFPSEIEVDYNGNKVTATDGYIVYPDGTASYVGNVVLSQLGNYSVSYYFESNGKNYVAKKNFSVSDKLYSLSADAGSIVAVSAEEQANKEYTSSEDDVLLTKQDGLVVRLSDKTIFNYGKSIDLTDVGEDGLCDIISIDYNLSHNALNPDYQTASAWKKYYPTKQSATYCVIRLTDSYDATNYIELFYYADFPVVGYPHVYNPEVNFLNQSYQSCYRGVFSASAPSQKRSGMVPWNSTMSEWGTGGFRKINVDGVDYGAYVDVIYGTFADQYLGQSVTKEHLPFTWSYDYKNNNVYVKAGDRMTLVTSLSNSDLYGTSAFAGFSKDKVKVSVYMTDYISDAQGRIDITAIGKDDGKVLVESFGKSGFVDDVAVPEIAIDTEMTDNTGIYAPLDCEFPLPKATVTGGDDKGSYSISVYANYGTDLQLDVPIVDGKFKVEKNIQYTVVYSAANGVGSVGKKILKINPVSSVEKAITLNTEFNLTQMEAGETVTLPEFTYTTINRNDYIKINIKAVHEKETLLINAENRTFVPGYAGEYKIVYQLSDNAFTVIEEFAVECVASNKVGFSGEVTMPKYFIKDAIYSLEKATAFSYANGYPTPIEVKTYISFDGGAFVEVEDVNNVKITGSVTAVVKYTCSQGGENSEIISKTVEIVDVNYASRNDLKIKNYFKHDGFTIKDFDIETNRKTDVKYDSKVQSGNNKLEFINAVDLTKLDVQFKTTKDTAKYRSLKVILTDYYDLDNTLSVEMTDGNPYCLTSVNGQNSARSALNFADDSVNKTVIYDNDLKKLTVNGVDYGLDLSSYFTTNLCYVSIELVDIYGNASIIIDSINGQGFRQKYSNNNDTNGPSITFEDFSGEYSLGSVITVGAPSATDVLSPISVDQITLTAKKDDKYVFNTSGDKLDSNCDPFSGHEIKLNENGRYIISYTAVDGFGNETTITCYVVVVDNIAPSIKFVNYQEENVTAKIGETVDLSVRVYDDYTSDDKIVTSVLLHDMNAGAFYSIADYKVKFNYAGKFEVYVTAKDQAGNFSSVKLVVTVK